MLVGPHHADQLCLPAHVGKVHLGLLLTLPALYEALIPKPLRPCFVRLAKPASASAFFLPCCICTPYSRGSPAAPPHPTTFSAAHGSDQPCVLPPPQRSRVRLHACRPPERLLALRALVPAQPWSSEKAGADPRRNLSVPSWMVTLRLSTRIVQTPSSLSFNILTPF